MNPTPALFSWPVPCREDLAARSPSFVAISPTVFIGQELLQAIEAQADLTGKNVRFCLHPDTTCGLQEMIILQHAGQYFPPKQHPHKAKSFKVLAGELAVFVFSAEGMVCEAHRLSSGDVFLFRVGPGLYHVDIPITPRCIHLETTTGPFQPDSDRIIAPWGPARSDAVSCHEYREHLLRHLTALNGGATCMSS